MVTNAALEFRGISVYRQINNRPTNTRDVIMHFASLQNSDAFSK